MAGELVKIYRDLEVYQSAFDTAMAVFEVTKTFPAEERYSLTDQIRRSSRSVCANLGEAWRKRRYRAAFIAKLSDCQAEATETQIWIEFAVRCGYVDVKTGRTLYKSYRPNPGATRPDGQKRIQLDHPITHPPIHPSTPFPCP